MRLGVIVHPSDDLDRMRALEAAGVDELWFEDGDPLVSASAAAVVTSSVGLTVLLDAPTPVTAKAIASLDALSEGRLRVVVSTEAALHLLRTLLSDSSGVPIRPAPVQRQMPIWTTEPRLAGIADGVVVDDIREAGKAAHVAILVKEAEPFDLDVEEVVFPGADCLWETVGKVLSD